MPSVSLSSLIGGSGVSEVSFFSRPLLVPSGTPAGTLFTITPPAGKRVILTHLSAWAAQIGLNLTGSKVGNIHGGTAFITANDASNTATRFNIGQVTVSSSSLQQASSVVLEVPFSLDEVVTLSSVVGTTQNINYAYKYGS